MTDYMEKAERLIGELIHAVDIDEDQASEDAARAALLAHIQRGAMPDRSSDATELRRLHALCGEMAAIVKSVANTALHILPSGKACRCSQCELVKEARAVFYKWKESK